MKVRLVSVSGGHYNSANKTFHRERLKTEEYLKMYLDVIEKDKKIE